MYCTHTIYFNVESTRSIGGNFNLSKFLSHPTLHGFCPYEVYCHAKEQVEVIWFPPPGHLDDPLSHPLECLPSYYHCFCHLPSAPIFPCPNPSLPQRDFYPGQTENSFSRKKLWHNVDSFTHGLVSLPPWGVESPKRHIPSNQLRLWGVKEWPHCVINCLAGKSYKLQAYICSFE